jgi:peptide-methionine (R)-S-oxide reductase
MQRRALLSGLAVWPVAVLAARNGFAKTDMSAIELMQQSWQTLLPNGFDAPTPETPLEKSLADWQKQLSAEAFQVLFEEGTERPFTSALNDEKRPGVFLCSACDLPLFTSAMKYDSGTGWPSFFTAIPDRLGTRTDFKLVWPRTEYHCVRCGGHQGHVFEDGPAPTGQRWCNNGVALRFVATNNS